MAFSFGDGFDLYATFNDAIAGYWDSGAVGVNQFQAGRFAGSQALAHISATGILAKSSGVNDPVHHIVCAFRQTAALSGSTLGLYFQLTDVAANQICIVFRSDGVILLTSATPGGTVLATYSGAVTAANTWFAFEFEVVIHNTAGSFTVRKNGNTSADFTATSLNTRPGANAYANKLTMGQSATVNSQQVDDLFWQSGAATGAWLGDIRAYTRMPASDASTQFARAPSSMAVFSTTQTTTPAVSAGTARYTPFVATYDGTVGTATVSFGTGYTGNLKCSLFASSGTGPTTVLGSANILTNPAAGSNTLTFGTPVPVVKGTQYWLGFDSDTSSGTWSGGSGTSGVFSTTSYASFPVASPSFTVSQAPIVSSITITTTSSTLVNETLQDGTTSYVYDSTAGHADFYALAALTPSPATVVAVTTRGFIEKSDAGTRTGTVQIKSGGTTVAAPTVTLSTSFGWAWRTDVVDPNTSSAWTASAVDAATIGPKTVA